MLELDGQELTLAQVAASRAASNTFRFLRPRAPASSDRGESWNRSSTKAVPSMGVNTGFGKLSDSTSPIQLRELQLNLVRQSLVWPRCAALEAEARTMLLLRAKRSWPKVSAVAGPS